MASSDTRDIGGGSGDDRSYPGIDPALVGHWRHTDSTYSGDFSMVTDTHIVLAGDGRFGYYTKTAGSFGSSYSPEEYGTWHTRDGVLYLRFDAGGYATHEYEAYPERVFLPGSSQRLWDRVT